VLEPLSREKNSYAENMEIIEIIRLARLAEENDATIKVSKFRLFKNNGINDN
jgi:hypothetical protein